MGKPYESEISGLEETYLRALNLDVTTYCRALQRTIDRPLLAVGSGGSLTAAHLIAWLHEHYTGSLARAVTPLDVVATARRLDRTGVLLISAGGSNPDVVDAFQLVAEQEPHATVVLSGREDSKLSRAARTRKGVEFITVPLLRKDGYLATNSLLAFSVLTWRAYAQIFGIPDLVPPTFAALLGGDPDEYRAKLAIQAAPLWERSSLVLLHGADTSAASIDFESRFVEAALGHVNVADFRNFAHGRHQWLTRYESEVAVLTFETARDEELGRSTSALFPRSIPHARIAIAGRGSHAAVAAVVTVMLLAAEAGKARGIDPGRPKVPAFGRRLFHLRGLRTLSVAEHNGSLRGPLATHRWAGVRKQRVTTSGVTVGSVSTSDQEGGRGWDLLAAEAAERITSASYAGAVFDYDGTLCDVADRYKGLSNEVLPGLNALLKHGIPVGIATGRGSSVHAALRDAISSTHWSRVIIGYYNGSEVCSLDQNAPRADVEIADPVLLAARAALTSDPRIQTQCKVTARAKQVTLELVSGARESEVWDVVSEVIAGATAVRLVVVRSSHSIDVLAPGITKLRVVEKISELAKAGEILRVGDRGRFPGNDFQLLATPYGLSVDEVSSAADECWNLAPAGVTGVAATAYYLAQMRFGHGAFRFATL